MTKLKKVIRRVFKKFTNKVKTKLYSVIGLVVLTAFSGSIAAANPAVKPLTGQPENLHIKLVKTSSLPIGGYSDPIVTIKVVASEAEIGERKKRQLEARLKAEEVRKEKIRLTQRNVISRATPERFEGGDAQEIARQRIVERWGEDQWPAFHALIQRESGWVVGNRNQSSGACGLAQAYPCRKLGGAYGNAEGEVNWAINYVANRYGTPANADQFQRARGWY